MATHKLADGGPMPNGCCMGEGRYPSIDMPPYEEWAIDYRKTHNSASLGKVFDWGCGPPEGCAACGDNDEADPELQHYLRDNVIAVGDIIEVQGLPMGGILEGVCWNVIAGCAGFTFRLQVRGLAGSSVPATVNLGPAISGAVAASGYVHFNAPLYFDHNDMLQFVVTGLCTDPPSGCGPCGDNAIGVTKLGIHGFYRTCCR